jgi:Ca-activated chloride channel homolog
VRRATLVLFLALASAAARAGEWSDLWTTREQQAQQLLDLKQPAKAAPLFADPRRRAYAELQAGQYAKAAEHLAAFKDADSQYNRGNALAHTGKLQDALAAYDAALAQSPGNRDVIRNRDLVTQALKQQSQAAQQQNGGNSQSGNQGKGQGQSNSGQSGQGANDPGAKNQDANNQGGQKQDNGTQPNSNGQSGGQSQQGNPSQSAGTTQPNSDGKSADQGQQSGQGQHGNPSQAGNQGQPPNQAQAGNQAQSGNQAQASNQAQTASQAQSARAQQANPSPASGNTAVGAPNEAAARPQAQQPNGADATSAALADAGQRGDSRVDAISAKKALADANAVPQQPRSEQALALDQWLRGIPEDSGELLRRKFLIEHMMKQQGNEP